LRRYELDFGSDCTHFSTFPKMPQAVMPRKTGIAALPSPAQEPTIGMFVDNVGPALCNTAVNVAPMIPMALCLAIEQIADCLTQCPIHLA